MMNNIIASYPTCPSLIPSQANFLVEDFSGIFLNYKTNVRKLGYICPRVSFDHHYHPKPSAISIQQGSKELNCAVLHVGSSCVEIVLNDIPAFPERFNSSYHHVIRQRCIATCFTQSLKAFLFTTTSCYFNFHPGTLF